MKLITIPPNQANTSDGAVVPAGKYYLSPTRPILQGGTYAKMNGRHLGWLFPPHLHIKRSIHPDLPLPSGTPARPWPEKPTHLRPWQRALLNQAKDPSLRLGLIWPMGAGKTLAALAIAEGRNAVILAPRYLHGQWADEAAKYSLPCPPVHTYESAHKLSPVDLLVLDESLRVKNPDAARSTAVTDLSGDCRSVIGMTGTPISARSALDMSWLNAVIPGCIPLGVSMQFQFGVNARWEKNPLGFNEVKIDGWDYPKLAKYLDPFLFSLSQEEVYALLPPKTHRKIQLPAPPAYQAARSGAFTQQGPLKALAQARQASSGFVYADDGTPVRQNVAPKIAYLREFAEDATQPFIIVSAWRYTQKVIADALAEYSPALIVEDTSDPEAELRRFQAGETPILIMTPAFSFGMNLQIADTIIFESCSTSPVEREQAIGRVYRPGQTKPVTVIDLIASPLDERLFFLLDRHREDSAEIIESLLQKSLDNPDSLLNN